MAEVIDSLVTELEYSADTKVLDKADKKLKELEKQSEATAKATDLLADEQEQLADALQKTADKEEKLLTEQRRLRKEIKAAKKPTDDQRKALARVGQELEENSIKARRLRNDMRALSIQQAKVGRRQRGEQRQMGALRGAREKAGARFDTAKASSGMAGVSSALGAVAPVAAGVAAAATGAAVAINTVVQAGAEMESLRARLKTVEGSVDGATEAFSLLRGIAKETPFELQDVTNAYVRLKSLGIQPTEQSLKAFGNVAAAQGKPIIDFIEAVADASTGEFERLKEFGIKASSQGEQVAFTFGGITTRVGKNAGEITKFLEGLGQTKFAGAMADQMNTFNGVMSNLKDTWTNFLDEIAQAGVLDEAKLLLKDLSGTMGDELVPIIADVMIDLLRWVRETFVDLRDSGGGLSSTLSALGSVVEGLTFLLSPFLVLWRGLVKVFNITIQVGGKMWEVVNGLFKAFGRMLDKLGEFLPEFEKLSMVWESAKEAGAGLLQTVDQITGGLFAQAEAIAVVKGSLQDLQKQVGEDVTKLTDDQLQELRQAGGEAGAKADAEIRKRVKAREASEKVEERAKRRDAYKEKHGAGARATEVAKDFSKLNDRQLAAFASDPRVPKKLRDKAEKEQLKRDKKKRKKGAAAGKKMRDATLFAAAMKQIEKNARELAQAEAARGFRAGELSADQISGFETRRFKEIKEKQKSAFLERGQLPAGIAQDFRQIAALPSINDLAGRTQAPVISNTINKFEITGNEFNAIVQGGTFEGTPTGFVQTSVGQLRRGVSQLFGEAIPNFATTEVR